MQPEPLDAALQRSLESFSIEPTDFAAFSALEQALAQREAWNVLAGVYECRLAALEPGDPTRDELVRRLARLLDQRLADSLGAQRRYEEILRTSPRDPEALTALRRIHTEKGRIEAALQVAECEEELDRSPKEQAQVLAEIAALWWQTGEGEEARRRLEEALRLDPSCDAALAGLTDLAVANGGEREAIRLCERRLESLRGADRIEVMLRLCELLPDTGTDRVRTLLRDVVREAPGRRDLLERLIGLEAAAADWKRVDELQRELWGLLQPDERPRLALEATHQQLDAAGDLERALFWASRAGEVAGLDVRVQRLRAEVLRRAGQTGGLIDALYQLVHLEGPEQATSFELAELLERENRAGEASDLLRSQLAAEPDDPAALALMDRCLAKLDRPAERVRILRRRIHRASDAAEAVELTTTLADLLLDSAGDPRAAAEAYRQALESDPTCERARTQLGRLLRERGDLHELPGLLQQLGGSAGERAAAAPIWCELGDLELEERNQAAAARSAYGRALACDPAHHAALVGLRKVAAVAGDPAPLVEACERELALEPARGRVIELLRELITASLEARALPRAREAAWRWTELEPDTAAYRALADVGRRLGDGRCEGAALEALAALLGGDAAARAPVLARLGDLALEQADPEGLARATHWYRESLALGPDPEVRSRLIDVYTGAGELPDLAFELRAALRGCEPQAERPLRLDLARTLRELGDSAGAISALAPAFEQGPCDVEVAELYLDLLSKQGHLEQLSQALALRLEHEPDRSLRRELGHRRASLLADDLARPHEAAAVLQPLVDPKHHGELESLYVRVLEAGGGAAEHEDWLRARESHAHGSERIELLLRLARLQEQQQRGGDAIATLQRAEQCAPPEQRERVHHTFLCLLREHGTADLQIGLLAKLIEQAEDPLSRVAFRRERARIWSEVLDEPERALEELEAAQAEAPLGIDELRLLASLYRRLPPSGRQAAALEALAGAVEGEEEAAQLLRELAALRLNGPEGVRDRQAAEAVLRRIVALDPEDADSFERLLNLLDEDGRRATLADELELRLRSVNLTHPARGALAMRLAGVRCDLGDSAAACEALRRARQQGAGAPALDELLFSCLETEGDLDGRIELCQDRAEHCGPPSRERWLRRWLRSLGVRGDAPEDQLEVIDTLLREHPDDIELMSLRLPFLRRLGRTGSLAEALEWLLVAPDSLSAGQRRVFVRELLRLHEGPLQNPRAALTLLEREGRLDPGLRLHGARIAAQLKEPQREIALLYPLVTGASGADGVPPSWLRRLALALWETGKGEQAEPLLWRALELDAHDREVLAALEQRLRGRVDVPGLLRLLEAHFPLEGGVERTRLACEGVALAEQVGDLEQALRWMRRWQALEPLPHAEGQRWLRLERSVGDPSGELRALNTRLQQTTDPAEHAELTVAQAEIHAERGELECARELYSEALAELFPPPVGWLEALDRLLVRLGHTSDRVVVLGELARHPQVAARDRADYQEERVALLASRPDRRAEAARELRSLIDTDPDAGSEALVRRMRKLLGLLEELEQASEWCALGEKLLPLLEPIERTALQRQLARRLTHSLHASARAIGLWEAVLADAPEDAEALSTLKDLLGGAGHEAQRADILERLARTGQAGQERHLLEAARVRWESLRDAAGALENLERALEIEPGSRALHELRAEVCAQLDRRDDEIHSLRTLLEGSEADRGAAPRWLRLGRLLVDCGADFDGAVGILQRVLALSEEEPGVRREVRQLLEHCAAWPRAAELLRAEIGETDRPLRPTLLRRLARIEWEELEDPAATCDTLEQLARLDVPGAEERLRWAEALAVRGEWPAAIQQRRHALRVLGESGPASGWLELADLILEHTQDVGRARDACDRALERDPKLVAALELRADLHARLGHAGPELEDRLRLGELQADPANAAAALARAAELSRDALGDELRAWLLFRAALQRDPAWLPALQGAGRIALQRGEWSEAERMLGLACSMIRDTADDQELAEVARLSAEAALRQNHNAEAFRYLELALECDPQHGTTLDAMAKLCLRLGALEPARRYLERRLEQTPLAPFERAVQLIRLADACERLEDPEQAAAKLCEVVELRPDDEATRSRALDLLERLGSPSEALRRIDSWLPRLPNTQRPALVLRAAHLESALGNPEEARRRLEDLLAETPACGLAWIELAALIRQRDGPEAVLDVTRRGLEQADVRSERAELSWTAAQALDDLGRRSEAAARAGETLRADPHHLDAARLLASHLGQAGDWAGAVAQLEHTLEVAHTPASLEAELWEAVGRAYAGPLEELSRAERCYRRALECNPLRSSAREALADITAFDPAAHRESVQAHRDLLEAFPARLGSWRALRRIADHWQRDAAAMTCSLVLQALRAETPAADAAPPTTPLADSGPGPDAAVEAATTVLQVLGEEERLPTGPIASDASLPPPLDRAMEDLVGLAWQLEDATLVSLWQSAADPRAGHPGDTPRRIQRRVYRAVREAGLDAFQEVTPKSWRAAVLGQAAARAAHEGYATLEELLPSLLATWPETSQLALASGGDLGAAIPLCPPAADLLRRAREAVIEALGY